MSNIDQTAISIVICRYSDRPGSYEPVMAATSPDVAKALRRHLQGLANEKNQPLLYKTVSLRLIDERTLSRMRDEHINHPDNWHTARTIALLDADRIEAIIRQGTNGWDDMIGVIDAHGIAKELQQSGLTGLQALARWAKGCDHSIRTID